MAEPIYTTLNAQQVRQIMHAEGYPVEVLKADRVRWKIDGFNASIYIDDDQDTIQFHSSFDGTRASMAAVNEWNRSKRFSRCYLDSDGDPHIELDLDLRGGVTHSRVLSFLRTCRISFLAWYKEVVRS